MPIDPLPPTPPDDYAPATPPAGLVDGQKVPCEDPNLNHLPHPFALSYGEEGARITFGQLLYRFDTLRIHHEQQYPNFIISGGKIPSPNNTSVVQVSQDKIMGMGSIIPTIGSAVGEEMDPEAPFKYYQLEEYGDIYLNWKVELDAVHNGGPKTVTQCYVSLSDDTDGVEAGISSTQMSYTDFQRAPLFEYATNRFNDAYTTISGGYGSDISRLDQTGLYSVKIGTVHEDERINQLLSSDVFFPFIVLIKHLENRAGGGDWLGELETATGQDINANIGRPAPES
jgi:hypothetical protein